MENRHRFTPLCKATIEDPATGTVLHALNVMVSEILPGKSGRPYRKVRAIAADGTPYYGYATGRGGNSQVSVTHGPLALSLYVGSGKIEFTYAGASDTVSVEQHDLPPRPLGAPRPQAPAPMWPHVEAIIRQTLAKDLSDASRVRRAMAMLFHEDADRTLRNDPDLLARANDLIDKIAPRAMA